MKSTILKRLLIIVFMAVFISCNKEEEGVRPLDLSGYTGLFYCRYKQVNWNPNDSGYAYLRILQKPFVKRPMLIVSNMGSDTAGSPIKSYEVDFTGINSFSSHDPGTGCSTCAEYDYSLDYVNADSINFTVLITAGMPSFWQKYDYYYGKRIR